MEELKNWLRWLISLAERQNANDPAISLMAIGKSRILSRRASEELKVVEMVGDNHMCDYFTARGLGDFDFLSPMYCIFGRPARFEIDKKRRHERWIYKTTGDDDSRFLYVSLQGNSTPSYRVLRKIGKGEGESAKWEMSQLDSQEQWAIETHIRLNSFMLYVCDNFGTYKEFEDKVREALGEFPDNMLYTQMFRMLEHAGFDKSFRDAKQAEYDQLADNIKAVSKPVNLIEYFLLCILGSCQYGSAGMFPYIFPEPFLSDSYDDVKNFRAGEPLDSTGMEFTRGLDKADHFTQLFRAMRIGKVL